MLEIRRLDERAKRALAQARAIMEAADRENRDLTEDENRQVDAYHDEAERSIRMRERLKAQEAAERLDMESRERERIATQSREREGGPEQRAREYRQAFGAWIRGGVHALTPQHRGALQRGFRSIDQADTDLGPDSESRVMTTDTAGTPFGGYAVPQDFWNSVERAMLAFNGVLAAPTHKFSTGSGAPLMWPTSDDTSEAGELLSETSGTAEATAADLVLNRVQFDSYTLSSKMVKVQRQLLQDQEVDLEGLLSSALGERLGRGSAGYLTTGTGTAQPKGIVTCATDSTVTFSIGTPTNYDDLVDLVHSVDSAYRGMSTFGLMFNDTSLALLRKTKDTTGQPIWNPGGVANNAPATILGHPYWINQKMAGPTGTNKAFLAGDFYRYKIRQVQPPLMLRLEERYAEFLQVAFLMFLRFDGDCVNTAAIKYAAMTT